MYYLINNDSELSFAQQIAIADAFSWLETAKRLADSRTAKTGNRWCVVKIEEVYTTQTEEA
jgi:hypothetical protein